MSEFSWSRFNAVPVIGILRGFDRRLLAGIVRASVAGGLSTLEVTMNSPGASAQIAEAIALGEGRLNVGAGTVTSMALLDAAIAAGASFIVTPCLNRDVVASCLRRSIPIFPGAFTPSEVALAVDWGASWVKLFPAEILGASYVHSIRLAVPGAKLVPTGGVNLNTIGDFILAGAQAVGVGSPLFAPERVRAEDWTWVENQCRMFSEVFSARCSKC